MKSKRLTPESQKTRMPFATVLLIALAVVILLRVIYALGGSLLSGADIAWSAIIIKNYFGEAHVGSIIGQIISLAISAVFTLIECVPLLVAGAGCVFMSVLMLSKKRNILLFIPTVVITLIFALLTAYNAILWVLGAVIHLINIAQTIDIMIRYLNYPLIKGAIDNIFTSIDGFSYTCALAALTAAWAALAFLFISCGKGMIGIFKRAQKIFFAIFCVALVLCATVIAADIAVDAICYLEYVIGQISDLVAYGVTAGIAFNWIGLILDCIVYLYRLIDVTLIMNVLSIITIFFIGLWLYSPYKAVRKLKKKKVDLVEFVELDCTEDSEVTFEVLNGENDDEFINISVHRPKQHEIT